MAARGGYVQLVEENRKNKMHIKQLPTLEQIKKLQELRNLYEDLDKQIDAVRKEYTIPGENFPPPLDYIIRCLKLQFAEEKIAESTAMVSP